MNPAPTVDYIRIQASRGWRSIHFHELWKYRELLWFLAWRDIRVRYKQTLLGAAWAVLQPLLTMLVFSLFFGRLGKMPSDGIPYPLFSFAALVPWSFFSNGLNQTANSMVVNGQLVKKVYFPRLAIPIGTAFSGIVDFAVSFLLLVAMMLAYGRLPTANVIWLPMLILLTVVTSLGVGLWLSALNVRYRDVRYTIPFLTQFWMLATPIAYPSSLLQEPWRTVYGLNPMVGVVEGFRWAMLGTGTHPAGVMAASCFAAVFLLISGALYFRRMERSFADVI